MASLLPLLEKVEAAVPPRLPLAPTMAEYRRSLLYFADLFHKLATVALSLEEMKKLAAASGKLPADQPGLVPLEEIEQFLARPGDFSQKAALREVTARLRGLDVRALSKGYWDTVYGIYGVIPHPVDPRAQGATGALFDRFNCQFAMVWPPTPLENALRATGKPFLLVNLGRAAGEHGWTLTGWHVRGEDEGEAWRASFDQPGIIARGDFQDQGYRWLVVRLTEGPQGGRKTIAVNGRVVAQFVRTGPPVTQRKEWWVTRCYPIPDGLLKDGRLEIRFTDPGVAISSVGLSAAPIADTKQE